MHMHRLAITHTPLFHPPHSINQAKEAAWEEERKKPSPDLNVKWIYAYVLVRSADARHKTVGIHLLKELVQARVNVDDSLYALAVAHYAMGKYGEAREEVRHFVCLKRARHGWNASVRRRLPKRRIWK